MLKNKTKRLTILPLLGNSKSSLSTYFLAGYHLDKIRPTPDSEGGKLVFNAHSSMIRANPDSESIIEQLWRNVLTYTTTHKEQLNTSVFDTVSSSGVFSISLFLHLTKTLCRKRFCLFVPCVSSYR